MAKSITKPGSTIICTGGTSGDPITMQDICDEDTAQGWGVATAYGNGFFQIAADLDIGDGSTSTYVIIQAGEAVDMTGFSPQIKANATFNIGEISNIFYAKGAAFLKYTGGWVSKPFASGGVFNMYNAHLVAAAGGTRIENCPTTIFNSTVSSPVYTYWQIKSTTYDITSLYIYGALNLVLSSGTLDDVHGERAVEDGLTVGFGDALVENLLITNSSGAKIYMGTANTITLKNPRWLPVQGDFTLATDAEAHLVYTCNIHIADKDGNNLSGVTILCQDKDGNTIFSVNTGADGKIAEQTITYKKWEDTPETETTYSPHKFTITKAGYETLVLDNITVDEPIDWHLELQDSGSQRPRLQIHGV